MEQPEVTIKRSRAIIRTLITRFQTRLIWNIKYPRSIFPMMYFWRGSALASLWTGWVINLTMIKKINTLPTISLVTILCCNSRGLLRLLGNWAESGTTWSQLEIITIALPIALGMKIPNFCIRVDRLSGPLLLESTTGLCWLTSYFGQVVPSFSCYLCWFRAPSCPADGLRPHIFVGKQNYYLILSKLSFTRAQCLVALLNILLISGTWRKLNLMQLKISWCGWETYSIRT